VTGYEYPENGLFEGYVTDKENSNFVVRVDNELAGFAIVDGMGTNAQVDYNVAKFFILRRFRHRGVGKYVVHSIFDRFKGNWEVMVYRPNTTALAFWGKVDQNTHQVIARLPVSLSHIAV
jgi:predicted acetyltransferase